MVKQQRLCLNLETKSLITVVFDEDDYKSVAQERAKF